MAHNHNDVQVGYCPSCGKPYVGAGIYCPKCEDAAYDLADAYAEAAFEDKCEAARVEAGIFGNTEAEEAEL